MNDEESRRNTARIDTPPETKPVIRETARITLPPEQTHMPRKETARITLPPDAKAIPIGTEKARIDPLAETQAIPIRRETVRITLPPEKTAVPIRRETLRITLPPEKREAVPYEGNIRRETVHISLPPEGWPPRKPIQPKAPIVNPAAEIAGNEAMHTRVINGLVERAIERKTKVQFAEPEQLLQVDPAFSGLVVMGSTIAHTEGKPLQLTIRQKGANKEEAREALVANLDALGISTPNCEIVETFAGKNVARIPGIPGVAPYDKHLFKVTIPAMTLAGNLDVAEQAALAYVNAKRAVLAEGKQV